MGIVILLILLFFKAIYRKLKWLVLLLLLGLVILLFYGQFFFATYGTEGERTEVDETSESTWQRVRSVTQELFRVQ